MGATAHTERGGMADKRNVFEGPVISCFGHPGHLVGHPVFRIFPLDFLFPTWLLQRCCVHYKSTE